MRVRRRQSGMTLVEVMIAVVIVGVMSAIAFPMYTQHIVKNNRRVAQALLIDLAQAEQQYLIDARAYTRNTADLHVPIPETVSQYYTISIATVDGPPPHYTITATPNTNTRQANDGTLSINDGGVKLPDNNW